MVLLILERNKFEFSIADGKVDRCAESSATSPTRFLVMLVFELPVFALSASTDKQRRPTDEKRADDRIIVDKFSRIECGRDLIRAGQIREIGTVSVIPVQNRNCRL